MFLSSIALKLTGFLDFRSVLSAAAWNSSMCHAFFFILPFSIPWLENGPCTCSLLFGYFVFLFFFLQRVEVKLTCCSLEVFHKSYAFSVLLFFVAVLLGFFIFIFYSAEVNLLPGFYKHFICCSVEFFHVPGFFYILSFYLPWLENCPCPCSLEH